MIDTKEYYGGTYPDPPEEKEKVNEEDYDGYIADYMHEREMLGED